jgi:subtilase family serine protease
MQQMRTKLSQVIQVAAMAALTWPCLAHAGVPYPQAATPAALDLGSLSAQSGSKSISVTIALSLPHLSEAESLLKSLHTPQDPLYHQFLTSEQFVARFAPADADVAKVVASLAKYGLTAERTTPTTLKVTGAPADIERAFSVSLHSYSVPAHANARGYTYHAPLARPTIPAEMSAAVAAVVGLDTRPALRPHHLLVPKSIASARLAVKPASGNAPGSLTVTDFAKHYDVDPLYQRGVTGKGRTLGILTFASFTPSDAFKYWKAVGLSVDPNRLTIINVDGGPGAPSDASGSDETTLDVEQSGGIAPQAKVLLYQGPNTNQAFVDVFAKAIDANVAQSLPIPLLGELLVSLKPSTSFWSARRYRDKQSLRRQEMAAHTMSTMTLVAPAHIRPQIQPVAALP